MIETNDTVNLLLNPARLRILGWLAQNGEGTAADMISALGEIPPASLYRHLKLLTEAGFVKVTAEEKKRGTVQKTYAVNQKEMPDNDDCREVIYGGLLKLISSFREYFAAGSRDPAADMLMYSTAALLLSDEEFGEMIGELGTTFEKYLNRAPSEGRKMRLMTLISSPCKEDMQC